MTTYVEEFTKIAQADSGLAVLTPIGESPYFQQSAASFSALAALGEPFIATITSPALGDTIRYDGTKWVNSSFLKNLGTSVVIGVDPGSTEILRVGGDIRLKNTVPQLVFETATTSGGLRITGGSSELIQLGGFSGITIVQLGPNAFTSPELEVSSTLVSVKSGLTVKVGIDPAVGGIVRISGSALPLVVAGDTGGSGWNWASIYSKDTNSVTERLWAFGARAGTFSISDETASAQRFYLDTAGGARLVTGPFIVGTDPGGPELLRVNGGVLGSEGLSGGRTTGGAAILNINSTGTHSGDLITAMIGGNSVFLVAQTGAVHWLSSGAFRWSVGLSGVGGFQIIPHSTALDTHTYWLDASTAIQASLDNATGFFEAKRLKVASVNGVICANAALATTATDGFIYLPSCAGVPTGVPTAQTGTVACVVDTTNKRVYLYLSGAWFNLVGDSIPG